MSDRNIRRRVAASRMAPLAALPTRIGATARYDAAVLRESARWLVRSREHTNYTYDLQPLNLEHLAWFVSEVAGVPVAQVREYLDEIRNDDLLAEHVRRLTRDSGRRGLADQDIRYARRVGWYALVRATRPNFVVETGTDKGLGSVVLAAALIKNGQGQLVTIDMNPDAGYLIAGPYADVATLDIGDSIEWLNNCPQSIDFFIHDSCHTREHERAEFAAVESALAPGAVALSDNSHVTSVLPAWAESTGRRFLFFGERPRDHWYPGSGIGVAWRAGDGRSSSDPR